MLTIFVLVHAFMYVLLKDEVDTKMHAIVESTIGQYFMTYLQVETRSLINVSVVFKWKYHLINDCTAIIVHHLEDRGNC